MDPLLTTIEYALDGLQVRMDAIAGNIANVNTPRYRAMRVEFESQLAGALQAGSPAPDGAPTVAPSNAPVSDSTSNVTLEAEMADMSRTSLQRQTLITAFTTKLDLLKTAAGVR